MIAVIASKGEGICVFDFPLGKEVQFYSIPSCVDKYHFLGSDSIAMVDCDSATFEIWSWRNGKKQLSCPIPEGVGVLAVSSDGLYVAAGSLNGAIFIWNIESGKLLKSFKGHSEKVNVLKFTPDDEYLLSGGDDSILCAWEMHHVLDCKKRSIKPFLEWTDHSLPISDIACGISGLIVSSSLDRTCKLWDIYGSRCLVTSLTFPSFLTSVCLDPCQRFVICGGGDGNIYKVDLQDTHQPNEIKHKFAVHTKPIQSLQLSSDGTLLISAAADGGACVFDMGTHQLIRRIDKPTNTLPDVDVVGLIDYHQYSAFRKKTTAEKENPSTYKPLALTAQSSAYFVVKLDGSLDPEVTGQPVRNVRLAVNQQWSQIQEKQQLSISTEISLNKKEITVNFLTTRPLGFTFTGNKVVEVIPDSQASVAKVQVNWEIVAINRNNAIDDTDVVKDALIKSKTSGETMIITFSTVTQKKKVFIKGDKVEARLNDVWKKGTIEVVNYIGYDYGVKAAGYPDILGTDISDLREIQLQIGDGDLFSLTGPNKSTVQKSLQEETDIDPSWHDEDFISLDVPDKLKYTTGVNERQLALEENDIRKMITARDAMSTFSGDIIKTQLQPLSVGEKVQCYFPDGVLYQAVVHSKVKNDYILENALGQRSVIERNKIQARSEKIVASRVQSETLKMLQFWNRNVSERGKLNKYHIKKTANTFGMTPKQIVAYTKTEDRKVKMIPQKKEKIMNLNEEEIKMKEDDPIKNKHDIAEKKRKGIQHKKKDKTKKMKKQDEKLLSKGEEKQKKRVEQKTKKEQKKKDSYTVLQGLKRRKQLNGMKVEIVAMLGNGRFDVRLDNGKIISGLNERFLKKQKMIGKKKEQIMNLVEEEINMKEDEPIKNKNDISEKKRKSRQHKKKEKIKKMKKQDEKLLSKGGKKQMKRVEQERFSYEFKIGQRVSIINGDYKGQFGSIKKGVNGYPKMDQYGRFSVIICMTDGSTKAKWMKKEAIVKELSSTFKIGEKVDIMYGTYKGKVGYINKGFSGDPKMDANGRFSVNVCMADGSTKRKWIKNEAIAKQR